MSKTYKENDFVKIVASNHKWNGQFVQLDACVTPQATQDKLWLVLSQDGTEQSLVYEHQIVLGEYNAKEK